MKRYEVEIIANDPVRRVRTSMTLEVRGHSERDAIQTAGSYITLRFGTDRIIKAKATQK